MNKQVLLFAVATIFSFLLFSCESSQKTEIIAHRGFWDTEGSAQNSIRALVEAQKIKAYGSEFDVWLTRDSVVVLSHDATINGKEIENLSYEELKNEKLSNGENLSTLDDYLLQGKKAPHTKLILEIKCSNIVDSDWEKYRVAKIVETVEKHKSEKQVEYISFGLNICKQVRLLQPKAKVAFLSGGDNAPSPEQLKDWAFSGLDYQFGTIENNPGIVKADHDLGLSVNVWTVNSPADIQKMIDAGVDFITTDKPLLVEKMLKERVNAK
jgi:glycerophosphoryl diester phosphodiesterase